MRVRFRRFCSTTIFWEQRKIEAEIQTLPFKPLLAVPEVDGKYPIIQQGDSPVLGYSNRLPFSDYRGVVLFGDHTLSLYKPDGPFLVATDGIRIIKSEDKCSAFLLYYLERYKPVSEGYKRYFSILIDRVGSKPATQEERAKIGAFLEKIDTLITLHQCKLRMLSKLRKMQILHENALLRRRQTTAWEQREVGEWGDFYYGKSAPKWSVSDDAPTPCIRYGELYTKFGCKVDRVYSYTNIPPEKLVFSKGTEVLVPRVGEDPMDYNHCTWLSLKGVAIGEMISVYNTQQNPLFTAIMFNATLQEEFAKRVEGGSVTNLYYDKLKNITVSFPTLAEQSKIAAVFENIDTLITLHQREFTHTNSNTNYVKYNQRNRPLLCVLRSMDKSV